MSATYPKDQDLATSMNVLLRIIAYRRIETEKVTLLLIEECTQVSGVRRKIGRPVFAGKSTSKTTNPSVKAEFDIKPLPEKRKLIITHIADLSPYRAKQNIRALVVSKSDLRS